MISDRIRELAARVSLEWSWFWRRMTGGGRGAVAPGVIISLTSFPPRYPTLGLTIKSLLMQRVRAEAVVLWIASGDIGAIPEDVRRLEAEGLRIVECDDIRSYKKFAYAIAAYPRHRIAICDDDTYYQSRWLGDLLTPVSANEIACHRSHVIRLNDAGLPAPYEDWAQAAGGRDHSPLNFATGIGGILVEANKFDPQITDMVTARRLSPTADDIWLYLMGRRAGSVFVKVGPPMPFVTWRRSQSVALWRTNVVGNANDAQMQELIKHFGTEGLFL